jgi:putative selenate reductase molybdopterin-binding subunit
MVSAAGSSTGSGTILAQIAAEVLGVRIEDIIMHPSDTDFTPFSTGTYSICGEAVKQAAEQVRCQLLEVAGQMLKTDPEALTINNRIITAPNGQTVTVSQVALHSLYVENQQQIIGVASYKKDHSSPSFGAQGVEVEVDTETGAVRVLRTISAIDAGRIINPVIAEAQIEGGAAQALGYGICEEMAYDQNGALLTTNLSDYRIYSAPDMPRMETYIVETSEPSGPFDAREIAEIPIDAMAPAIANAVTDALGIPIRQIPLTPERVLRAVHTSVTKR